VATERFDLVLFDLGGVLIRLGGVDAMQELAGIDSEEEVWARWLACRWVRGFERGQCAPEAFASGVVSDWELSITPIEFLERFRSWPEALYDGAADVVKTVRSRVQVGCLTNTNSIHWDEQGVRWGLDQLFDTYFLSHELGLVKPDQEIFAHVSAVAGCPNQRIVFLDDNAINVEQAQSLGFRAHRVSGPDEARDALVRLGVLPVQAAPDLSPASQQMTANAEQTAGTA
jgi:putative hydrolase of the HAD superfamily